MEAPKPGARPPTVTVFHSPPQELEEQFERERLSLEEQKTLLMQQLEELRQELTAKLAAAHQEVT